MRLLSALGPPGTGKTTFGLELVRDWRQTLSSHEIGYLAFTRAAAHEAVDRVGGVREEHPWFRTIHSLCYRLMQDSEGRKQVMTAAHYRRFSKETGMEGAYAVEAHEELADVYLKLQGGGKTEWDRCRTAYTLTRLTSRNEADLDRARKEVGRLALTRLGFFETPVYRSFVEKLEAFKEKNGLVDFTDMLEGALRNGVSPGIKKLVVDECQDLCGLHYAIMDRLFDGLEEVWFIGDDDQSIFSFSGASAKEFLGRIRSRPKVILRQTHRFGQGIVDFSERIIHRVKDRIEKNVIGWPGKTGAPLPSYVFEPKKEDALILHRHVDGCRDIAESFMVAGLPFSNERGKDPLSSGNRVKAYLALKELARGESVQFSRLRHLLEDELPSIWITPEEEKIRYMPHGAKKKLETEPAGKRMNIHDLLERNLVTEMGVQAIQRFDIGVMKHEVDLRYYQKVEENGHTLSKKGAPVITTIHGSKGRQAPHVYVFTEMSRRCWEDSDSEHRLAYVAATRTQNDVTICEERRVDWAGAPYAYPVEVS